jgi:hypothetical protein
MPETPSADHERVVRLHPEDAPLAEPDRLAEKRDMARRRRPAARARAALLRDELERERRWAQRAAIISVMIDIGREARKLGTAAGFEQARRAYVDAARLYADYREARAREDEIMKEAAARPAPMRRGGGGRRVASTASRRSPPGNHPTACRSQSAA